MGGPYSDFYIANVVQSYMQRMHGAMPPTHVMMPEYHEATQRFFAEYVRTFPVDLVTRAYASVLRILDEMHVDPNHPYPQGITNQFLYRLFEWRSLALDHLPGGGRYFALAALLLLACASLRWAFAALFLLLYFAGYPAIQFNLRHAFPMEFISLWTLGFLAQTALSVVTAINPHGPETDALSRISLGSAARRVTAFVLMSVLSLAVLWAVPCIYQHFTVGRLVSQVSAATLDRLPYEIGPAEGNTVTIRLPGFAQPDSALPVQSEYVVVELKGADSVVPVTFAYEAEDREHFDYTRTVNVQLGKHGGPTRLYFPLYYSRESRFLGVRLPQKDLDRLMGICRVKEADTLPLWLTLTVPPDWKSLPRRQSLTR